MKVGHQVEILLRKESLGKNTRNGCIMLDKMKRLAFYETEARPCSLPPLHLSQVRLDSLSVLLFQPLNQFHSWKNTFPDIA